MISKEFKIEEFVNAVKDKDPKEVITLALQESTKADRIVIKKGKQFNIEDIQTYSRQLKQLIDYHRYSVKPRRHIKKTYNLYMKYWGDDNHLNECLQANQ
ncbi:uncharacterized protein Dvar_75390 [Desulfosarcina variabilis str. Montpellier]|uniref:hypothetical protein n=1 Tax=Desulfosarcina variabilis TaxID=2300 RepID=UPI003AFAA590